MVKLVELFCGTGGFSRGAHAAGFEVAAAYDIDATLTSSYPINFPGTKLVLKDIGRLTGDEIHADVGGEVFGVFGGPPCQGFSDIGKRDATDPRRQLLGHFFRIVAEIRPTFFVMENVRGLIHKGAVEVLEEALEYVIDDYDIFGPTIFNAADFGAATIRNRVFVVGVRKSAAAALTAADFEAELAPPATVRAAIADLERAVPILPQDGLDEFQRWRIAGAGRLSDYAAKLISPDRTFTSPTPTEHTAAVVARFANVLPGRMDKVGRHPRLAAKKQCPTLRAGTGRDHGSFQSVRPIHYVRDRVITVREAARLQGFPDAHIFHPTTWHSFRMIGNSVSPIMAEAVFSAVRDRLSLDPPSVGSMAPSRADEDEFLLAAE